MKALLDAAGELIHGLTTREFDAAYKAVYRRKRGRPKASAAIDSGTSKRRDEGADVMAVAAKLSAGVMLHGLPVAVVPGASMPAVLIEGYTRCMAALRTGQQSIELYFASPEPATAAVGSDAR